jgi:hypothetical protein
MRVALGLILWFLTFLALSLSGTLDDVPSATLLAWGLALPAGLYTVAFAVSPAFRRWLAKLPLREITLAESLRIFGGTYILWKHTKGELPSAFALPTGLSDIVIAASAIPASRLLVTSEGEPRPGFVLWHLFSLTWLVISSSSGMLTSPPALSTFPLNLIPVFFGPLMILLSFAAIAAGTMNVSRICRL